MRNGEWKANRDWLPDAVFECLSTPDSREFDETLVTADTCAGDNAAVLPSKASAMSDILAIFFDQSG